MWHPVIPCQPEDLVEYLEGQIKAFSRCPRTDVEFTADSAKKWVETMVRCVEMPPQNLIPDFLSFVPKKYQAGRSQSASEDRRNQKTETLFHIAAKAAMKCNHDFLVKLVAQMQVLVDFPGSARYSHELLQSPLRYALMPKQPHEHGLDDNASSVAEEAFGFSEQMLGGVLKTLSAIPEMQ